MNGIENIVYPWFTFEKIINQATSKLKNRELLFKFYEEHWQRFAVEVRITNSLKDQIKQD